MIARARLSRKTVARFHRATVFGEDKVCRVGKEFCIRSSSGEKDWKWRDLLGHYNAIMIFGSHAVGDPDLYSDVDVLIISDRVERSYRRRFVRDNIVLDLHAFSKSELVSIIERQVRARVSFYVRAIVNGIILEDEHGFFLSLKRNLAQVYSNAPKFTQFNEYVMSIDSLTSDLRRPGHGHESIALAYRLYHIILCVRSLRIRGWVADMKTMKRWIGVNSPNMLKDLDNALTASLEGDYEPLVTIALNVKNEVGEMCTNDKVYI